MTLTPDEIEVRDLAREVDPLDMAAHLMARGYRVVWPCTACNGTGTIPCDHPDHGKPHHCLEQGCKDARCAIARHLLHRATIEADRIRHSEAT